MGKLTVTINDITIEVDDDRTICSVINELISYNLLIEPLNFYFYIGDNGDLDGDKTFADNGVTNYSRIKLYDEHEREDYSPPMGSPDKDLLDLWLGIWQILENVDVVLSISGVVISFRKWFINRYGRSFAPNEFTQKFSDKELWNVHELAKKLKVTDEQAKCILRAYGYAWNKHYMAYCKTDKTKEIIKRLKNFSPY